MTLSQHEAFSEIESWANNNNFAPELEICYHTLGLNPKLNAIGNLAAEFQHPESQKILTDWSDNLLAHRLTLFTSTLKAVNPTLNASCTIPHAGSARENRQQFEDFKTNTYLLALVTNPLSDTPNTVAYNWRRKLRLWLVLQNAFRVTQYEYRSDAKISIACSFLLIGFADSRWQFIDSLLDKAHRLLAGAEPSFERFTSALRLAADQTKSEGRHTVFLNALIAIASGQRHPAATNSESSSTNGISAFPSFKYEAAIDLSEAAEPQQLLISKSETYFDDSEQALLVTLDPEQSKAQQTLSSGSIFLQSMELSHFLPWSWDKPHPYERQQLSTWIESNLQSSQLEMRVGAAIVNLSVLLARSLARIQKLKISDLIEKEWSINRSFTRFQRQAPRRQSSWQPADNDMERVHRFSNDWLIKVPEQIAFILSSFASSLDETPNTLESLWLTACNETLEVWFKQQARNKFSRLTSRKLGEILAQTAFDHTGDHNLARLVSSHHQSGLPGPTAYATWDIAKIEKGMSLTFDQKAYKPDNMNIIGSLLQPLESLLSEEIANATEKLLDTDQSDVISFHNMFAQYCVVALYAGTGTRDLRDPFETPAHFNLRQRCVFINDKNDSGLHKGRLVPLPDQCANLLEKYFKHIKRLSNVLTKYRAILSKSIQALTHDGNSDMPLFFLLDPELKWHSMSDTAMLDAPLFKFGLPKNLFRHRYSQRLAAAGVDTEIIQGWMGHSERGVGSYSDYSLRCWQSDIEANRDIVNQTFDELDFKLPPLTTRISPTFEATKNNSHYTEPTVFGEKLRIKQRKQRTKQAIKTAKIDIELFLAGRAIDALTAEDINELIRRMLHIENALIHPRAATRMAVLTKHMERTSEVHRRLIRKRVVSLTQEYSQFNAFAPSALSIFPSLRAWAKKTSTENFQARLSKPDALLLGSVLFSIEKRVSYSRLLIDLASGKNYRFIQHKKTYFLEYSEELDRDDYFAGVQRHTVSYKTASLLAFGTNLSRKITLSEKRCTDELTQLLPLLFNQQERQETVTADRLIKRLCDIIDQINLVDFPGLIAGVLSGRTPSCSLPITDWLRVTENILVESPNATTASIQTDLPLNFQSMLRHRPGYKAEHSKIELQQNAKEFFRKITLALATYTKYDAKRVAVRIDKLCDEHEGKVSTSILLVGKWISYIINRGQGRGDNFRALASNSVKTYFSSLTVPFSGLAYDIDLLSLDTSEITELYEEMLEFKRLTSTRVGFLGDRLVAFHRWGKTMGLATPKWADWHIKDDHRSVSAGLITDAEYLESLAILDQQNTAHHDEALMMSFVLIIAYRFGLRAKEAICLRRNDWCEVDDKIWLLIRNNAMRTLKRNSSRRVVPLLFQLEQHETIIIERIFARYAAIAGSNKTAPILCELINDTVELTQFAGSISKGIALALRAVTQNPQLNLHHCRHSFYNRVAPALFGADDVISRKMTASLNTEQLRKIVLGEQHAISRRSGMGAARLMGHSRTTTGTKSYNHFVLEWADQLTPVHSARRLSLEGALDTKTLKTLSRDATSSLDVMPSFQPPSLANLLKSTRLASLGYTFERAGELLQLHPEHIQTLKNAMLNGTAHMRVKSRKKHGQNLDWVECRNAPLAVIQSLNASAWERLITLAKKHPVVSAENPIPKLSEAVSLLGRNRHAFISHEEHAELLTVVMEIFNMKPSHFKAIESQKNHESNQILKKHGFTAASGTNQRLDSHQTYFRDRRYYEQPPAGVIFQRNAKGCIRNSIEFAVAYLATAAYLDIEG